LFLVLLLFSIVFFKIKCKIKLCNLINEVCKEKIMFIGERLKFLRNQKRMTQKQLSSLSV